MNYPAMVGSVIATCTLLGIGYAAALKGGWVTDKVIAKAIAQEVVAREEQERLEFQLEYKRSQLKALRRTPKEERSEDDLDAIEDLKGQIELIKGRLGQIAPAPDDKEE